MADERPIALWAVPRSISTAFERVFVERGDFRILHEPFSMSYYFSPERRSERFDGEEIKEEHRYEKVLAEVLAPGERPVFFKDMAYHIAPIMDRELVGRIRNTFLMRDPRAVIASYARKWPDFTFEEAGYEELYRLYGYAVEDGQDPAVIDAQDLSENPDAVVAAYCDSLGIDHKPEALTWEPREIPEWEVWDGWHDSAQESTGIGKLERKEVDLPDDLEEIYRRCLPYYEALYAERLRV
ncbi:sulfotransferase family protein [Rubrobacter marinus]|uniref:Sulfotransferase family protein n=1 Tax=Rubrobacter marinus TaxID=2653852 RepID=A0A6G8PZI3_9ACTN|nr:sulfotransferase family protein [Rubrobacter marinus]QIN79527.1 sulfotransferase family protein [Rubrobacter marinus]